MKIGLRIVSVILSILFLFYGINSIFVLWNMPNDIAVAAGWGLLFIWIVVSCWAFPRLFQWWMKPVKRKEVQ